ncbi:MAG: hypothetical protein P4L83_18335 [Nevskia sp.]|nr:hypothetical protein [Nevskia sp.]
MNLPAELRIEAAVDPSEHPALVASAQQLAECLTAAVGRSPTIQLNFADSFEAIGSVSLPVIAIVSLLPELARSAESWSETRERWQVRAATLVRRAIPVTLLCTIFRHVAERKTDRPPGSSPSAIERIRRLNLLAAGLSHATGIGVADVDRVFAHFGARMALTDHRLNGTIAAELAGHTIVSAILASDLDAVLAREVVERAKEFHGTRSQDIVVRVQRRLAAAGRPAK